jgi:hypothetical protein
MKKKIMFLVVLVASVVTLVVPAIVLGNSNDLSLREQADKLEAKAPKDLPKRTLPKNCAVK